MEASLDEALRDLLHIASSSISGPDAIQRIRLALTSRQLVDPTSLASLAHHLSAHGTSLADERAALSAASSLLADTFPDQASSFSLALSTLASPSSSSSPLDKFRKALGVAVKMMLEGGGTMNMLQSSMTRLRPSVSEDSAKMTASAVRWVVGLPKGKTLRPKDLAPLAASLIEQRLDYLLSRAKPAHDKLIGRDALEKAIQEVRPLELRAGGGIQSVAALEARRMFEQQQDEAVQQALAAAAAARAEQDDGARSSSSSSSAGDDEAAATQPGPGLGGQDGETARTSRAASSSLDAHAATFAAGEAPASLTASTSSQTGSVAGGEIQGDRRDVEEKDEVAGDEQDEGEEGGPAAAEIEEEEEVEGARLGQRANSPLTPLVSDDDDAEDDDESVNEDGLADGASARGSSSASERSSSPAPRRRPTYSFNESDDEDDDAAPEAPQRKRRRLTPRQPSPDDDDGLDEDQQDALNPDKSPASPPPPVLDYDPVARTTRLSVTPGPPSFKSPPDHLDLAASPRDILHLLEHPPRPDSPAHVDDDRVLSPASTRAPEVGPLDDKERARLQLGPRSSTLAAIRALEPDAREQAILAMEEQYARLLQGLAARLGASMAEAVYWHGEATLFDKRSSFDHPSPSSPEVSARIDELARHVLSGDSALSDDGSSHGSDDDDDDDWVDADERDDQLAAATRSAMQEAIDGLLAAADMARLA